MRLSRVKSGRSLWSGLVVGSLTALSLSISAQTYAVVTDVQINSIIEKAIRTNPLVSAARAEQEATTEGVTAAKLNLLPTPSFTTGYDREDDIVSQVTIRQPLWTGGQLTANVNQAIFDDKAATEFIYEQQNAVAKRAIEAWQSYITAVAQQRVYLENLEQLSDFEATMKRRVAQGVSARIELELVTNRILQEQNAYQAAAEQQRIAAARLEQIVGQPLSEGTALSVPKIEVLADQAKRQSTGFEQMAFNQASFYNPTVIREQFEIESAKQEVQAQRASRYPTVYAQYEHYYLHEDNEDEGNFSLGLSYEPGAGFSTLALARASQARVNSLIQSQEAARRDVLEDIQVQYQQFASAKDREASLIAAVAGAQIVVNSYRRQFIAGRKTWLEVLNAVREYGDYQIQLVQTRADILGSFYKLQVDFGIMPWQQFNANRQPTPLFDPVDSVKDWLNKQTAKNTRQNILRDQRQQLGYNSGPQDDFIEISLPPSAEERLNNGEFLLLDEDYTITPIVDSYRYSATDITAPARAGDAVLVPEPSRPINESVTAAVMDDDTIAATDADNVVLAADIDAPTVAALPVVDTPTLNDTPAVIINTPPTPVMVDTAEVATLPVVATPVMVESLAAVDAPVEVETPVKVDTPVDVQTPVMIATPAEQASLPVVATPVLVETPAEIDIQDTTATPVVVDTADVISTPEATTASDAMAPMIVATPVMAEPLPMVETPVLIETPSELDSALASDLQSGLITPSLDMIDMATMSISDADDSLMLDDSRVLIDTSIDTYANDADAATLLMPITPTLSDDQTSMNADDKVTVATSAAPSNDSMIQFADLRTRKN